MKILKLYINKTIYLLLTYIISFYQKIISPILPARCRYYPTCSNYGKQALAWHGIRAGSWLLVKRIGRCHPLGGHGVDFVPLPLASYSYLPVNQINAIEVPFSTKLKGTGVYADKTSYVARLNHTLKAY